MIDEPKVKEQLKTVFDPEIPVNIVDLGLVYGLRIEEHRVEIDLTVTAPGCGMGEWIAEAVRHKVRAVPEVEDVAVRIVYEPPWDRSMISEAGKLALGLL
jgi:metal-sulfur cluster biosynthetic enzyme